MLLSRPAVMCEEVACTVHIARQLGEPLPIAQPGIDSLYARYQNVYVQPREQMIMTTTRPTCWFLGPSRGPAYQRAEEGRRRWRR